MPNLKDPMLYSLFFAAVAVPVFGPKTDIQPVPFTQVHMHDGFWEKRIKLNHDVTIWHEIQMCEETGRIDNFRAAAGVPGFKHEGYLFNDSDVYKVIEAAAYILATEEDAKLEAKMDEWIELIAKAQEGDGYLQSQVSASRHTDKPMERWADNAGEHELYNVGHFYEAAVAYRQATGKTKILDAALKNADLICATYNLKGRRHAPGHEEIEIGLVKLSQLTGERKYLDEAKYFLDERGSKEGRKETFGEYSQDHQPVLEQDHAVGHSVRAAYLYCGMIDVGTNRGDARYIEATKRIWEDVVRSKIYLTGGIGSSGSNEGFAKEYELPNLTGYSETCASIANVLWNERLFQATGDGKYIDVLERSLYNGVLSGYGADGKSFFYPNPLQSVNGATRSPWFACACCPPNVARLLPKVPELMYATDSEGIYVNLYAASDAEMTVKGQKVSLHQGGNTPTGDLSYIDVHLEKPTEFTVRIRVPGWARNQPMPGNLYTTVVPQTANYDVRVENQRVKSELKDGYLIIPRVWQDGDQIYVRLPQRPFWVKSNPKLKDNEGLVALQIGPFVYCAEMSTAQGESLEDQRDYPPLLSRYLVDLKVPEEDPLKGWGLAPGLDTNLFEGLPTPWLKCMYAARKLDGSIEGRAASPISDHAGNSISFIPYFAWANRGRKEMSVWIPTAPEKAFPLRADTIASMSPMTVSEGSQGTASIKDQLVPKSSLDQSLGNQHWWPKKGTKEWVEFMLVDNCEVSSVKVYWFDDTGVGECRVPESWRVLVKVDGEWKPVEDAGAFGVARDGFNVVNFNKVRASGLRIEVQMQKGWSTGIHEVVIE
jgi:DUF1680 family protein